VQLGVLRCLASVSSGELFDKILAKSKFTEQQAQGLFHQMVLGINYLHSKGVAHR
jgi:serine/threonine protein kinase